MMNAMGSNGFTQGWKRRSSLGAILVAASAWLSGSAWAANAVDLQISYSISPQGQVSVSHTNQTTYMAVHVSMTNTSTNTINQVLINSSSSVFEGAAPASAPAPYDRVVAIGGASPTCSATTSGSVTSVSCSVGQLKGGDTSDFFVIYRSPLFATLPTSPSVTIAAVATFSEGNSPNTPTATFPKDPVSATLALVTTDTDAINSGIQTVLPDTGTFFTGLTPNVVSSTPSNQFATSVNVPSTKTTSFGKQTVTNNSIAQTFAGTTTTCATIDVTYFCYGLNSAIEVLDASTNGKLLLTGTLAGPQITIVLTQDASSLSAKKPVPKIGDIRIFYTYPNPSAPPPATIQIEVLGCGSSGPALNTPCISGTLDALKGGKGYYQWTIKALDNGNFSW